MHTTPDQREAWDSAKKSLLKKNKEGALTIADIKRHIEACEMRLLENPQRVVKGTSRPYKGKIPIKQAKYSNNHYEQMRIEQNDRCAICNTESFLYKDHDHNSGFLRGLLCHTCNIGLGFFEDNEKKLNAAIFYVSHWKRRHKIQEN